MKKQYRKPELHFEDFSLMNNISNCSTVVSSETLAGCRFVVEPFGTVHSEEIGGCTWLWKDDGKGFCSMGAPNGTLGTFGS